MFKASIELGQINKNMKLKFCLIIKNDSELKNMARNMGQDLINYFTFNGSEYLRINPRPFITIDISSNRTKNEAWNSNMQVNLGKPGLYKMVRVTQKLINNFKIEDLFYIQRNKLQVDKKLAMENMEEIYSSNKKIRMIYSIVINNDNEDDIYEGIAFCINGYENFCMLTYDELILLHEELKRIDMNALSMQLLNSYILLILTKQIKESKLEIPKVIQEEPNTENINNPTPIEIPHEIPEI